ncbi:hypothetical protein, conserved [Eimeria praecox]|uniref:Uncharacterized protein n=1 Tax=Eimeria praecox TaxID=51316 RepID=U6G2Z4_9EIME|nr:hypothetical protein, conserved [Eimeria praecox]
MGGQRHDAGTSLVELSTHEVGGEGVRLTLESPGNNEQVAKQSGFYVSFKSSGKQVGAAQPLLFTFLLLLLLEARYNVSSRLRSYLKPPQLPLDDASMQKYMDDFNRAARAMKDAWESSEMPVRRAFQQHFTPSLEDGQELSEDPLKTINDHVAKMQKCKIPTGSKARKDFALHVQLLRSICRSVALRVHELNWFVYMNEEFDVPVPVPGRDERYRYPALEELEKRAEDGLTASHFLKSVGLFATGESLEKVDEMLTDNLIFLLSIENKQNVYNSVVRYFFERFLEPSGEEAVSDAAHSIPEHQVPYSGKAFRTRALKQAAAHIFRGSGNLTDYGNMRKMHRIADNWTSKGVLEAAVQQEEDNTHNFQGRLTSKREQMRILLEEGLQYDDLVISVLFLL